MSCRYLSLTIPALVFGVLLAAGSAVAAPVPIPRAFYDFENISGETIPNVVSAGTFDGFLGTSSSDSSRDPALVPGLRGDWALQFDSTDIARVPSLVTDINADRIDEDVFSGSFSTFARLDTPNVGTPHVMNADKGPTGGGTRGWYLDFCYSSQNGQNEWLLSPRYTSGSGGTTLSVAESETTNYKNIESIGITFLADPTPGGSADGYMEVYINGQRYGSRTHNQASPFVGEVGFSIGAGAEVSYGNGIIIDDLAVWDLCLTETEMYDAHTAGVIPEPSTLVLFGLGLIGLVGCRRRRRQGR